MKIFTAINSKNKKTTTLRRRTFKRVNVTALVYHTMRKLDRPMTTREVYEEVSALLQQESKTLYLAVFTAVNTLSGQTLYPVGGKMIRRNELKLVGITKGLNGHQVGLFAWNPEGTVRLSSSVRETQTDNVKELSYAK